MSRTDKDDPWWVRAEWFEPYHRCEWYHYRNWNYSTRTFSESKWIYRGECDLALEPTGKERNWYVPKHTEQRCYWRPEWTRNFQTNYHKHKREWRRTLFHGPQRAKVRLAAREVVKGNYDYEFPDGRGRHGVLWYLE